MGKKDQQQGFLLGLVSVFFLLFTIAGVSLLTMAYQSKMETVGSVQKLKNKYDVESMVNLSLWEINTGANIISQYGIPDISTTYVDSTGELIVSTERYGIPYGINVKLEDNTGPYESVWPKRIQTGSWGEN